MSGVVSVIAVTVASSLAVLICRGGKYEKQCSLVCCAVIALTALTSFLGSVKEINESDIESALASSAKSGEDQIITACGEELEERLAAAVESEFGGISVEDIEVSLDRTDPQNLLITGVRAEVSGAESDEVADYISDLILCDNVKVERTGGDDYGY